MKNKLRGIMVGVLTLMVVLLTGCGKSLEDKLKSEVLDSKVAFQQFSFFDEDIRKNVVHATVQELVCGYYGMENILSDMKSEYPNDESILIENFGDLTYQIVSEFAKSEGYAEQYGSVKKYIKAQTSTCEYVKYEIVSQEKDKDGNTKFIVNFTVYDAYDTRAGSEYIQFKITHNEKNKEFEWDYKDFRAMDYGNGRAKYKTPKDGYPNSAALMIGAYSSMMHKLTYKKGGK